MGIGVGAAVDQGVTYFGAHHATDRLTSRQEQWKTSNQRTLDIPAPDADTPSLRICLAEQFDESKPHSQETRRVVVIVEPTSPVAQHGNRNKYHTVSIPLGDLLYVHNLPDTTANESEKSKLDAKLYQAGAFNCDVGAIINSWLTDDYANTNLQWLYEHDLEPSKAVEQYGRSNTPMKKPEKKGEYPLDEIETSNPDIKIFIHYPPEPIGTQKLPPDKRKAKQRAIINICKFNPDLNAFKRITREDIPLQADGKPNKLESLNVHRREWERMLRNVEMDPEDNIVKSIVNMVGSLESLMPEIIQKVDEALRIHYPKPR